MLHELFAKYGTDKAAHDGYTGTYEHLLSERRDTITRVLEVGIGTLDPTAHSSMVGYAADHYSPGGSLRAWRDYFPHAVIWGIDVAPDTQFTERRIVTRLADSASPMQLDEALGDLTFDLIIDDGDHNPTTQVATLFNLWSRVKPCGHYVIEDIAGEIEITLLLTAVSTLPHHPDAIVGPARNLMVITCPTTSPSPSPGDHSPTESPLTGG